MKPYTELSETEISQILLSYDLAPIVSFTSLSGGSENSNFLVQNKEGEFVVTIFEKMSRKKTASLASLLQHLTHHQFVTNEVITTVDGINFSRFKDKPVIVKRFVRGEIPIELNDQQLEALGRKIAELHKIPCPDYLPGDITYGQDKFHNLFEKFPHHSFAKWLSQKERYLLPYLNTVLPKSIIHADIFTNNLVIDSDGEIIIFDFEEACYFSRVFDLGMAVVGVCCPDGQFKKRQAQLMLKGYQQKSQLSATEKKLLVPMAIYAATATAYWRFMQFNVFQADRGLQNHYQGMQRIADQLFELNVDLL